MDALQIQPAYTRFVTFPTFAGAIFIFHMCILILSDDLTTTLFGLISVGYHLELHIAITFY